MISTVLRLLKDFIFKWCKYTLIICILMVTDEKSRIRSKIRIRKSVVRIRGSGSVPICHGSTTLVKCLKIGRHFSLTIIFISQNFVRQKRLACNAWAGAWELSSAWSRDPSARSWRPLFPSAYRTRCGDPCDAPRHSCERGTYIQRNQSLNQDDPIRGNRSKISVFLSLSWCVERFSIVSKENWLQNSSTGEL